MFAGNNLHLVTGGLMFCRLLSLTIILYSVAITFLVFPPDDFLLFWRVTNDYDNTRTTGVVAQDTCKC